MLQEYLVPGTPEEIAILLRQYLAEIMIFLPGLVSPARDKRLQACLIEHLVDMETRDSGRDKSDLSDRSWE